MMDMVRHTQFWADVIDDKKRAKTERLFRWARSSVQDHNGVFWIARLFQRAFIFLSDDLPGEKKWLRRQEELMAKGYQIDRCVDDLTQFLGNARGDVPNQFQQVFDSLRAAAATNKRLALSLERLTYTKPDGTDKTFHEVYQAINDLGQALGSIEKLPKGETIIAFPDGSKWVDIGKQGCEHEAALMRHCGNRGGRSTDKLWSYREPSGSYEGYFEPRMTFIFDPAKKALGEMKGKANQKPKPEYHPAIVALLKTGKVESLQGQGYAPEQNFSINDLSDELLLDLYKANPALVTYQAQKGSGLQKLDKKKFDKVVAAAKPPEQKSDQPDPAGEAGQAGQVAEFLNAAPVEAPPRPTTRPAVRPDRPTRPGVKPFKLPPNTRPADLPRPKAEDTVHAVLGQPETLPPPTRPATRPDVRPIRPPRPGVKPFKLPPNTRPADLPRPKAKAVGEAVNTLLEMPMDTGEYPDMVHQDRKHGLKTRKHPMGANPAYPEHQKTGKPDNFEELVASEQYQATLKKLTDYFRRVTGNAGARIRGQQDLMTIGMQLQAGLQTMVQIEAGHKERLEELAVELVFQLPKFKKFKDAWQDGEFIIDAQLGQADLEDVKFSDEVEDEREEMENYRDMDLEVQKRHAINAMIHGGAVGDNYAFHLVQDELNAIDPKLVPLYGLLMASTEIGYFVTGDAAIRGAGREAGVGSTRLNMDGETPVIKARGITFPVLVQEVIKGLFELVSVSGLPADKRVRKHVIDKADLLDAETWHMLVGRGLWNNIVKQMDLTDSELTMQLYHALVSLPPREFNDAMKKIQAGGPEGKKVVKDILAGIQDAERDQAQDDLEQ